MRTLSLQSRRHERTPFWRRPGARPGSTRDATTGLMNAGAFSAVAAHVLRFGARRGEPSALVCCCLPAVAAERDLVRARRLGESAARLTEVTRGEDVLGRTGELELCALLPGADAAGALAIVERLDALGLAAGWADAADGDGGLDPLLAEARARALKLATAAPILPWEGTDAP